MANLPKGVSPRFVTLTERRQEFLVCSRVGSWVSHWDVQAQRSRRCAGQQCALCMVGSPKQLRFVVLAMDEQQRECLLEFREKHRDELEKIDAAVGRGEGARIMARKEGGAKNSPVVVKLLTKEPAFLRAIERLVESMGLPGLRGPDGYTPEAVDVSPSPLQRNLP